MKFHLLAGTLLLAIGSVFYLLIGGMSSDFSTARPQIEKESVQKALKKQLKSEQEDYSRYLNKNIHESSSVPMQKKEIRAVEKQAAAVTNEPTGPEEGLYQGERYWCRHSPVQKMKSPVKCHYQDSCFKCQNSYVITPENDSAIPFCENGSKAEMYSVECCPIDIHNGEMVCPSQMECLSADSVPDNLCTCGNKPDCKYVAVGEKVECACIQ
jgi:hypothetical protein